MYKRIDEVLQKILSYKNCGNIIVYTNGTIVPKGDKLKTFKNDKMSKNGIRCVLDKWTWEFSSKNLDKYLKSFIKKEFS